jgi:hypothetical protein
MYAEEHLPDDEEIVTEEPHVFDDISTIESSSTIDTEIKTRIRRVEEHKRLDRDFYKIRDLIVKKNQDGDDELEVVKIDVYSTAMYPGVRIRQASSGIRTDELVGSKYEDLYFKVMDTSAPRFADHPDPRKLYYRNPEEFERHMRVRLPQSVKETWQEKNMLARSRFCRV